MGKANRELQTKFVTNHNKSKRLIKTFKKLVDLAKCLNKVPKNDKTKE